VLDWIAFIAQCCCQQKNAFLLNCKKNDIAASCELIAVELHRLASDVEAHQFRKISVQQLE